MANDNTINMAQHRGPVIPCKYCKPEARLLGQACPECMGQEYVAICLNCDGTGKESTLAVWGGRERHSSTCNICGGRGHLPARAAEYKPTAAEAEDGSGAGAGAGSRAGSRSGSRSGPASVVSSAPVTQPMKNLHISRS